MDLILVHLGQQVRPLFTSTSLFTLHRFKSPFTTLSIQGLDAYRRVQPHRKPHFAFLTLAEISTYPTSKAVAPKMA